MRIKQALLFAALALAMGAGLSACGGSNGTTAAGASAPSGASQPAGTTAPGPTVHRTLIIGLDGVIYGTIQAGLANGSLPNLAKLQVSLAYGGGSDDPLTLQANQADPGWATILSGTWVNRHQVTSDDDTQAAIHDASLFDMVKAGSSGLNGVATANPVISQLMASQRTSGSLDALDDCSTDASPDDCVTQQASSLIDNHYTTVVAQYTGADNVALENGGTSSAAYVNAVKLLDGAVGTLLAETAKNPGDSWQVIVTSAYGLSNFGSADGLPLLPESTTFIAINQPLNNTAGVGAAQPADLAALHAYPSLADITPTVLAYLNLLPNAANYAMDGAELTGDQAVSQLALTQTRTAVSLNWAPPASGEPVTILRDGQVLATLADGSTSYTDNSLVQYLTSKDASGGLVQAQINYAVQAGTGDGLRSNLTSLVSFAPLAPTLTSTGDLLAYYPFGSALPATDMENHSILGPSASDLPAAAGTVLTPGPFGTGSYGLDVNSSQRDANLFEGYRLNFGTDTQGNTLDPTNQQTPAFTIGFWFKVDMPTCLASNDAAVFSNKNYVSGGDYGLAIGLFSGTTTCGIAFNLGSNADPLVPGSVASGKSSYRIDGPSSPYTPVTVGQWAYIAMAVDAPNNKFTWYVWDPVLGLRSGTVVNSSNLLDWSKLYTGTTLGWTGNGGTSTASLGRGGWGVGTDGTTQYIKNKNVPTTNLFTKQAFSDIAIWKRPLTTAEVASIYQSKLPLSTLSGN